MRPAAARSWCVYRMTLHGNTTGGNVVCRQSEWEAIDRARPGYHTLLHSGIETEQEAEKLARGTAGDSYRRGVSTKARPADLPPPAP